MLRSLPRRFSYLLLLGVPACAQPLVTDHAAPVAAPTAAAPPVSAAVVPAAPCDCAHPFGLYDDAELVYDLTDGAGRKTGQLIQRVVRLEAETNKKQTLTTTTALLKSGLYDARNRLVRLHDLTYACHRDTAFTDGAAELAPDALSRYRDRLFDYAPTRLAWPHQPTAGSPLPDGGLTVDVRSSAVHIAAVYVRLKNRRVVGGPEVVTTPAGAFQCYKVEAERETGTTAHTDIHLHKTAREVTYYSPAAGIVRAERYDKDKLVAVQVLVVRRETNRQNR